MPTQNPFDDDRAAPEQGQEDRSVRLLHRARNLRGLTPEQVRRIAVRLDVAVIPVRRRSLLPVLAVLALLLSAGTAVAWGTGALQRLPVVRALFIPGRIAMRPPQPAKAAATPGPSAFAAPAESGEQPRAALERSEASRPPRREDSPATASQARKRVSIAPAVVPAGLAAPQPRVTPPPMPDNPIAQEGESFANVLRRWRRQHDGRAALSALDLHDRSFAGGQMALESRLLRVEILLSERHDREALALLDGLALGQGNVPRGRELLTVRGELRIKTGRCDDGRADLASIGGGTDALAERARNALTHCQ